MPDKRSAQVTTQYESVAAAAAYASGYEGWGPIARYNRSRFHVVDEAIQGSRGALLDIGCGPGMLVRHLLEARPDLRITACDQSAAMVDAVAAGLPGGSAEIELEVASIEDMPFADGSFDVVVALGVLEYVDGQRALSEIARVVRPGGTVVVTMLNPASPYRLFEWCVYWPARRALGQLERLAGVPPERRHGAKPSGIRAIRRGRLRRLLRGVGLDPIDDVAYDVTPFVPPFDRLVRRWARQWRQHPERTVSRGGRRWLGTGYLIRAQRPHR